MNNNIKETIEALKKNNISARYYEDSTSAVNDILKEIDRDSTVGIGGSVTVKTLGIDQKLIENGQKVFFHWLEDTAEKKDIARANASTADVYLTSTNAITEKGQLVNIDGVGNRVASMIYGPRKVIVVSGTNKIVKNLNEALERIKLNAYKNARRLQLNTPCAKDEECFDCSSPQRMCNVTTIINKKPAKIEFEVIIINESLGF